MEQKVNITLKDIVYIISLCTTLLGSWFTLRAQVRELELEMNGEQAITSIQIEQLKAQVQKLESQQENNSVTTKQRNK